jgi:fermentation-respiration switch protein FrsA (DUF1100 family)
VFVCGYLNVCGQFPSSPSPSSSPSVFWLSFPQPRTGEEGGDPHGQALEEPPDDHEEGGGHRADHLAVRGVVRADGQGHGEEEGPRQEVEQLEDAVLAQAWFETGCGASKRKCKSECLAAGSTCC